MDSAKRLHKAFRERIAESRFPSGTDSSASMTNSQAVAIFRAQCVSRNLDLLSRRMQKEGNGFYTIGSSGHENMATVAEALRIDDMAFLHYRDAAFQIMRSMRHPGATPIRDMLLSFSCSTEDPISGGRHKVLGSRALNIPPQTSTIASHLPKAVGAAFSIGLSKRFRPAQNIAASDSIVVCSFGDASCNHSTAQGAINAACWTSYKKIAMPLLFVCEDNGLGISVPTPSGWVAANFSRREGLQYFHANGLDLYETWRVSKQAADYVRLKRKPAFLHLSFVRLLGHAGSDIEATYLSSGEIKAAENNDPLLHSARLLAANDVLDPVAMLRLYDDVGAQCERVAQDVVGQPRLASANEVMSSIVPPPRQCAEAMAVSKAERDKIFGTDARLLNKPQSMSRLINWALTDLMSEYPEIVIAGEDVGRKGGVYGVTQRLQQRFGVARAIDTLLDEQAILGLAIGMAQTGLLPIPEIQFLAYLHNAEDQLRGEAATLSFFSNGQYTNPMVVRIAGLGYQRGFGGHFHNDNSLAVLRDIPGLILACPSNGYDAVKMLRECIRLARVEQRLVVFLEPIALYGTRDLNQDKDGEWASIYPERGERLAFGEVGIHGDGEDLAIISYGNGYYLSRQAAKVLGAQHDIATRVIDIRWLSPLPAASLIEALIGVRNVLVVDECRRSANVSEGLLTLLHEQLPMRAARVTAEDSFIPTGPAYASTLPSKNEIVDHALKLVAVDR